METKLAGKFKNLQKTSDIVKKSQDHNYTEKMLLSTRSLPIKTESKIYKRLLKLLTNISTKAVPKIKEICQKLKIYEKNPKNYQYQNRP